MKTFFIILCVSFITYSNGWAQMAPVLIDVGLQDSFVPRGFDDDDKIQFAVQGTFSSSCYQVGPSSVRVDQDEKLLFVEQKAFQQEGLCLQAITPFTNIVEAGVLNAGAYKILDTLTSNPIGSLVVDQKKEPGGEVEIYAPITEVLVTSEQDAKGHKLILQGVAKDRCTVFKEITVDYQDQERVIVVKPLLKPKVESIRCPLERTKFAKTVEFRPGLAGLYLLHVRASGKAVTQMVEF